MPILEKQNSKPFSKPPSRRVLCVHQPIKCHRGGLWNHIITICKPLFFIWYFMLYQFRALLGGRFFHFLFDKWLPRDCIFFIFHRGDFFYLNGRWSRVIFFRNVGVRGLWCNILKQMSIFFKIWKLSPQGNPKNPNPENTLEKQSFIYMYNISKSKSPWRMDQNQNHIPVREFGKKNRKRKLASKIQKI